MSIAGELARFLARTNVTDLPPLALERARMVIASTIASAAMGSDILSSRIIRELGKERGGAEEATLWFDGGRKLPVADAARANAMMSDAAASDDSDLRSIAHIGTIVSTTAIAMAERTGASGRDVLAAMVLGYEIAGRIDEALHPGTRRAWVPRLDLYNLWRRGGRRHARQVDAGTDDAGDRAGRDVDRRPHGRRQHQRGARVPGGTLGDARHPRGARRAERIRGRGERPRDAAGLLLSVWRRPPPGRDEGPRHVVGHHHQHGDQARAGRPSAPRRGRSGRQRRHRGRRRPARRGEHRALVGEVPYAARTEASDRPDRRRAQPRLLHRGGDRRPRLRMDSRGAGRSPTR